MNYKTNQILKIERILKHWTQGDIAKILNIEQASYAKYETGKLEPSNETLIKLADIYDVTTDYLLGRDIEINKVIKRSYNAGILKGNDIADEILKTKRVRKKKET